MCPAMPGEASTSRARAARRPPGTRAEKAPATNAPVATVQKVRNRAPNSSAPAARAGSHARELPAFSHAYGTPGTRAAAYSNPVQQAASTSGSGHPLRP